MRLLVLLVTLALAAPHAEAGEFMPRQPKAQPTAPAPTAKAKKPKPMRSAQRKKITRTASKAKKPKKRGDSEWKRPMP